MEQKVLRGFKQLAIRPRRVLLAISGGVDSMVMAEILWKWRSGLRLEIAIAHVHHGTAQKPDQTEYRDRTQQFVREWAESRKVDFHTNDPAAAPILKNEQNMREFREKLLGEWCHSHDFEAVAFAHHQDDLLETRLIRLIRGSGAQGLRSMCLYRRRKFRPLLALSGQEIRTYARVRELKWVEDPSNARADILRNWLRRKWLPSLENRRPGATQSLARSLELLAPPPREFNLAPYVGLRRDLIAGVSHPEQKEILAHYLHSLGLKNYARTHVDEILKRLSSEQKNIQFEMLGLRFNVSHDFLWASRV